MMLPTHMLCPVPPAWLAAPTVVVVGALVCTGALLPNLSIPKDYASGSVGGSGFAEAGSVLPSRARRSQPAEWTSTATKPADQDQVQPRRRPESGPRGSARRLANPGDRTAMRQVSLAATRSPR